MRNFLFEQYGYYPKNLENNTFYIDGWMFKIIEIEIDSEQLNSIENYVEVLKGAFNNKGPFIIKNKSQNNISVYGDKSYTIVSTFLTNMSINDLMKFHGLFFSVEEYIELDKILLAWKERVDDIESKLSSYLRLDSIYYKHNLDISTFCIGLAINAMQYLSDEIYNYDNKLYGATIVHKRLTDLNSFDFFNPFNFIVEHPLKDIVLLYQSDYLSFEEVKNIFASYSLDVNSATFFMARLLYRTDVFDFLETKRDIEKEQKINFNLKKEMNKIKKAYSLLKERYFIRPIDWLEEYL